MVSGGSLLLCFIFTGISQGTDLSLSFSLVVVVLPKWGEPLTNLSIGHSEDALKLLRLYLLLKLVGWHT